MTKPVLLYDGGCCFCRGQVARLSRWLGDRLEYESFRDPGVLARHPEVSAEACESAIQLIEPGGRVRAGADAITAALRLRRLTAPAAWIYAVPVARGVIDRVYELVARYRFRLRGAVGGGASCGTHGPRDPRP